MRKLYPDEDVDTISGLSALAQKLGVDSVGRAGSENGLDDLMEGASVADDKEIDASDVPEGWLVAAPRGGLHYVGSASLVFFARCAREIVGKSHMLKQPAFDEHGLRRYMKAAEFTNYKVSHTIEANIQGHPATVAAQSEVSPSTRPDGSFDLGVSPRDGSVRGHNMNRQLANRLVAAYFDRVHLNFPVLHRGAFQVQYEKSFAQSSLSREPGWTCTLYLIYTLGAQALEGELVNAQEIQQEYLFDVIREGLGRLILTSTLANVQALLLLSLYEHNAGERNTAWILIGQALRAGVALGLHRDGENNHFDPFERNIRRSVWWTLHLFEQFVSLALGRPSFTDAFNVNASLPDRQFEISIGLPAGFIERNVSLFNMVVKIKQAVAIASIRFNDPQKLMEWHPVVMALQKELTAWKSTNSTQLENDLRGTRQHNRQLLLLLVWSAYMESVLCRPFLLCRVSQDLQRLETPPPIVEIASLCVTATLASAQRLAALADSGLLEGALWLDFYAVQHAIMIASLQSLGQPTSTLSMQMHDPIHRLISAAQRTRLAPTYRITMNVALQLAFISGIASDVRVHTRPHSPSPGAAPMHGVDQIQPAMDPTFNQIEELFGLLPNQQSTFGDTGANSNVIGTDLFSNFLSQEQDSSTAAPWDFFTMGDIANGGLGI